MKPSLPPSATHPGVNLFGLAVGLLAVWLLRDVHLTMMNNVLIVMAATALPILLADFFFFRRQSEPGAELGALREKADLKRVGIKWLGLFGVLLITFLAYVIFPEYNDPFYRSFWPFFTVMSLASLALAPCYFAWCDRRQNAPEDGYYHFGRLLMLRWHGTSLVEVRRFLRNWLVKGFFLPIMFAYSTGAIADLYRFPPVPEMDWRMVFLFSQQIILLADLIFSVIGYVLTLRIFGAQIRSSEPTFFGWVVAVICYPPFWTLLLFTHYFPYEDGVEWHKILPEGVVQWLWGGTILALLSIYTLATICLGIRFSNLTYRGLITSGPYRFTKHPAYVAKNLSWCLISMPFIAEAGGWVAFTHSLMLIGVNILYYFRARTEEHHLSNYPEYVAYALAMNERSIFAPLVRLLPFLKYRLPENLPKI